MPETRFTKDHEWVRLENGAVVVGITDHAQQALGDLVFVQLPEPGTEVTEGEACAVVESVKAASDVYAPLSGRVSEINVEVGDNPGLVNTDPAGAGWLFKLELSDAAAFAGLMTEADYLAHVEASS